MKTIVKYQNRKLYDLEESRYIKASEVYDLIPDTFVVVDKATGKDITEQILITYMGSLLHEKPKRFWFAYPALRKIVADAMGRRL